MYLQISFTTFAQTIAKIIFHYQNYKRMKTITYLKSSLFLALFLIGFNAQAVDDVLTATNLNLGGSSYSDFSNINGTSGTVYAGNAMKKSNSDAIQMRSKDNSGIVTTTSIGNAEKIVVVWNEGTTAKRKLDIYGSATPYTHSSNLYSPETQGTLIGSIDHENGGTELALGSTYPYIGIRSNDGALYLDQITISWASAAAVNVPVFSKTTGQYAESFQLSITGDEGATIYYTLDGNDPSTASTQYTQAINITATTTVKAIAVKGEDQSAVASATYTFPTEVANIAAFQTMQDGDFIKITGTVTVVYSDANSSVYLQDASGSTLIYDRDFAQTEGLINGKTMTGLAANIDDHYGSLQLTNVIAPALADGSEISPVIVTEISPEDLHKYVMFENVQFKANADFTNRQSDGTLTNEVYVRNNLYNTNLGAVTADKNYNVAGFVSVYRGNAQLYPISITEYSTGSAIQTNKATSIRFDGQTIYNPENANIVVYSLVGTVVAEGNTDIDMSSQNSGIYIVRSGKSVIKIVKQ